MVEIKRKTTDDQSTQVVQDGAKYRLIYTKSKVYVNPTAYARDNIPGFVAIVKRVRVPILSILAKLLIRVTFFQEAVTLTYLLAWIPESLLTEKGKEEWDKFLKTEERPDEDEGVSRPLPTIVHVPEGGLRRWRVDRLANTEARVIRLLCTTELSILSHSPTPFFIFVV
jgi:hypothetical protein